MKTSLIETKILLSLSLPLIIVGCGNPEDEDFMNDTPNQIVRMSTLNGQNTNNTQNAQTYVEVPMEIVLKKSAANKPAIYTHRELSDKMIDIKVHVRVKADEKRRVPRIALRAVNAARKQNILLDAENLILAANEVKEIVLEGVLPEKSRFRIRGQYGIGLDNKGLSPVIFKIEKKDHTTAN